MENQNPDVQTPEQVDELKKTREKAISPKKLKAIWWVLFIGICGIAGMLFYAAIHWIMFEQKVSLEPILLIAAGLVLLVLFLKGGRPTIEKLEDLSIDKLNKRKKTSLILLYLLIGAFIFFIIEFSVLQQEKFFLQLPFFAPIFVSIAVVIVLIRKIDKEIHGRENK